MAAARRGGPGGVGGDAHAGDVVAGFVARPAKVPPRPDSGVQRSVIVHEVSLLVATSLVASEGLGDRVAGEAPHGQ